MSSGSGNAIRVLGVTTTTAGIAVLPATGNGWLAVTMICVVAAGLALVTLSAGAALIKRLG